MAKIITSGQLLKDDNNHVTNIQMRFFNENAKKVVVNNNYNQYFDQYVNKEQYESLRWIRDKKKILEYGCGTGESLDKLFKVINSNNHTIYGVDIAKNAITQSKIKYPKVKLFVIRHNKIPQISNASLEAVFMFHVLHHSSNHQAIFKEVYLKLKKNGKYVLNDLSSKNPIISLFRFIFTHSPKFIKHHFDDDLLCNDQIPDKYQININETIKLLKICSFKIEEVGYGHLFFFVFGWIERFIPLSSISFVKKMYSKLIIIESKLLKYSFFQQFAEVYYIKAVKV